VRAAMGVHSAAAVVVLALVVGAVAEGDSLADLGGAAREIEGAPGTPRRGDLSLWFRPACKFGRRL
jgi:hypothetical protein